MRGIKIRKALTQNIPLKIAALVIAVILWLFVTSKGQTEMSFDIPVEFVNIPKGLDIVRYDVKSVNIVVRGYERFVKNIKQGDLRLNIDISKAKRGENQILIRQRDIQTPSNVSVIRIDPSSVKVVLEEKTSKKVVVRPIIIGRPERGYYISRVQTFPEEITIVGTRSELRRISRINTEPIDITGLKEDFIEEVSLDIAGKKIEPEREKVKIIIRIVREKT